MLQELIALYKRANDYDLKASIGVALLRAADLEPLKVDLALIDAEVEEGKLVGKISAIKEYRQRTGRSLADAKRAVEAHFAEHGLTFFHNS